MDGDSLAKVVADLLQQAPKFWADVPEGINAEALVAITGAGFVERRITCTVRLPGEEQGQRIVIEATGEFGLPEAMHAVLQDWWARWGERWRALRQEIGEPVKPIVTLQRDEWRLTEQGQLAQSDLGQGDQTPIDFALKRGFFDGRPQKLPNGRVVRREPVRGYGRLVSIENAPSGPLQVDVAKFSAADELAQAFAQKFAEAFAPLIQAATVPKQTEEAAEFVFARSGDGWLIRAFGEEGHFRNLRGFEHIAKLLAADGRPVPMMELVGGQTGTATVRDVQENGLSVRTSPALSPQPIADDETLARLRRDMQECRQEIEKARRQGDVVQAGVLEKDFAELDEQYKKLTRPGGHSRTFPDECDRLQDRIYRNLKRAYERLRENRMPATADHLEAAIEPEGDHYVYRPTPPLKWVFDN